MKLKKRFLATSVLSVLVVLFMGTVDVSAAFGEINDSNPVAYVMVSSSGISFMPKVNYARLVLNVARADGSVFQKTFDPSSSHYLDLSSIFGEVAYDGTYTYELRVVPTAVQKVRKVETLSVLKQSKVPGMTLTQSGSFLVRGGMIVVPTGASEDQLSQTMDVIHNDDVIITGSLCLGFDCQDGETFGYCTHKLKENNLQICFEDTSTDTFPTNDWKIQVNDTTSGGASYFTIGDIDAGTSPFTIEAGAPTHSLYVEDYGRVGLGTSVPYMELHIVDGDTPTVRLDQDVSSGWSAQAWDMAGNETNFFIRDVTNGSKMPFRIQPNCPSSMFCMKSDGKIGIGTWSPGYPLELETTGTAATFVLEQTDGATAQISGGGSEVVIGAKSNNDLKLTVNDSPRITINTSGYVGIGTTNPTYLIHLSGGAYSDGTQWKNASSLEYKENIHGLTTEEAMHTLNNLNPVKFNYKINKEEECLGFIAEEVPDLVAENDRKALSTMDIVAVLTKVVQEQQKCIQEQQMINSELKKKIAELEKTSK